MGLQEIDIFLGKSQPSIPPPPARPTGGGVAAIDAFLGGQGVGMGESFARGFMGSIPAQIALAMAKHGIVAQSGEIPPQEPLPPPAEIAAAARRMEEELAPTGKPTIQETVARGLGTIIPDLPFYITGGYGAAKLARPLLSKAPPLLAKVAGRLAGSVGAFETPAIIREAATQAGEGEFVPERFAKEMGIGGGTGAAVGAASLIPNPLLRVPAEVVAMVGAESLMRHGKLPTFRDLLEGGFTIAALQAAFRLAGLAFPGGERAGGPVRGTESADFKGAMEAKPPPESRLPGPPAPPGATTEYARPRQPVPEILREAAEGRRTTEPVVTAPPAEPTTTVPTLEIIRAEIERLRAENARLRGEPVPVVPQVEPVPVGPVSPPSPIGVGDPVEYRPKLSDRPITGAVSHVNADGTVNIRARTGGVIRNVPVKKVTSLLTPDEVGLDSKRIGNRVALGEDDKAILGEMRETIRDTGGEVAGKIFLEGGEVGQGGGMTVKGFKTPKPPWMEIPDEPGEYYKYPEVVKVLESLRQGKWPKTAKQARIAEQLLQETRFDAEAEKGRLAGWEQQTIDSETAQPTQPTRDQAIQDRFFAEVDRLAAEEAGAVQPTPPSPLPAEAGLPTGIRAVSRGQEDLQNILIAQRQRGGLEKTSQIAKAYPVTSGRRTISEVAEYLKANGVNVQDDAGLLGRPEVSAGLVEPSAAIRPRPTGVQEGPGQPAGPAPEGQPAVTPPIRPSRLAPDAVLRSVVGYQARQAVGEPRSVQDYQAWEDRLRAQAKQLYADIEATNLDKGSLRWDYAERELGKRKRLGLPSTIEEAKAAFDKSRAMGQTIQHEAETVPPASGGTETPQGPGTAIPPEAPRPASQAEGKVEEPSRLYQIPKESPGTTLGSLGGAFQEAAGYLPESIRTLPERYRTQIAQPALDHISAKMPKVFKEARGLGQEVVDLRHNRGATLANYFERAIELSGKVQEGLKPHEKARVDQILRGGITTNPVVEKLVAPLRELINELQAKLIKYGYLTPEDVEMFRERFTSHPEYLRRLYSSKLVPPDQPILAGESTGPVGRGVKSEALMMRGDIQEVKLPLMGGEPLVGAQRADFLSPWLKKGYRLLKAEGETVTLFRDIPETLRKAMGEIRGEPGYVAARTIAEQARIVANHEFLDGIRKSQDPNIAPKPAMDILDKQGKVVEAGITDAELATGEWTQLKGDKRKWGPLADMYVRKDVALELESSIRLRADWEKVIGRLVGMWKFGKVIVNPAAMGRNVISSGILADFGGLHPWMVDEWAKGSADFARQSGLYAEAKKMGLFRSTYTANEIMGLAEGLARSAQSNAILRVLDGMHEIAEATGKKTGIRPAVLYGTIESFYRFNLYRYYREGLGLTPVQARREALKYAIDYEVVSPAVAALRGTGGGWLGPLFALGGSPFVTFSSKAIPLTLETLALHPLRVGKYIALIYGVSKLAGSQIGQQEEETKAQRQLGELNPVRYALLPWRDKDGRAQYFDLGYTLPFGDLIEAWDWGTGGAGRRANVAFLPVVGHPSFAVAEAILNKSGFTGKELSAPSDTALQSLQKRIGHVYQSWMPSLAPPAPGLEKGGFAYEDLRRAFVTPPETDFLGRTRSPAAAVLANVAGLRTRGVTTEELASFRARQYIEMFNALDKEALRIAAKYQQNPDEARRQINEIVQRGVEIAKEAQGLFDRVPPRQGQPTLPSSQRSIPPTIQRAMEGAR